MAATFWKTQFNLYISIQTLTNLTFRFVRCDLGSIDTVENFRSVFFWIVDCLQIFQIFSDFTATFKIVLSQHVL